MKGYIHDFILLIIGIVFGIVIFGSIKAWSYVEPEPIIITEYKVIEAEPEIITKEIRVPVDVNDYLRNLTEEDKYYLMDRSMAEAENQGVIGHCWAMYTIICRCEAYGKSIKEVCESGVFDSSKSRWGLTPNDDCKQALALIEEGWTPKPLWFRRDYYHGFGTPLCRYGDHCFSCK